MTPMIRAVIYLKLRDGMTHEEIARHLGITTRMVRRLLTTAYMQLRDSIALD
jgi:DNA-directed RNA polymerase specialized sigma24 family protein